METLGQTLREAREAQDITLAQLNEMTKIELATLESIEAGKADHLPSVYFRAFVRSMAEAVALDPETLLQAYQDRQQTNPPQQEKTTSLPRKSKSMGMKENKHRPFVFGSISIVLTVLAVLFLTLGKQLFIEPDLSQLQSTATTDSADLSFIQDASPESFILRAEGVADSKVFIQIDSADGESVMIKKGENLEWIGEERISIRLQNNQSIRLSLNEKLLEWTAPQGAGVYLSITPKGIVSKKVIYPPMVGHIEVSSLFERFPLFVANRDQYDPDENILSKIETINPSLSLVCFLGTWHERSQEVVPQILRVLRDCRLPDVSLLLIGVDRSLKDTAGMAAFHKIEVLPTLLILDQGRELGRITGKTESRVEERLLSILKSSNATVEN